MKKRILGVLLVVGMLLVLSGCSKKEAVTADGFKSTMEDAGYTITDSTKQFEGQPVDSVQLAVKDEYQIEFFVVPTVDQAQNAYNQNKSNFEKAETSSSLMKSVEMKNFSYYAMTSGGIYYVVSRVDNTFIYVHAPEIYKDEISDIISELGY
ncbi:hypothetical protein [Clostridium vincentii]|uniref:DUF4367 domain-containing protein n=1 Tax=Clostridium vincentii TaxID=52704 RepID=A0A2T0B769_9CLOT|nr:hypothetical protein [Clostridium vincentii]PRR79712.1 hypothetical protein CLVI_32600 [Clostridium vincentii]